jgi:hypothetical protein
MFVHDGFVTGPDDMRQYLEAILLRAVVFEDGDKKTQEYIQNKAEALARNMLMGEATRDFRKAVTRGTHSEVFSAISFGPKLLTSKYNLSQGTGDAMALSELMISHFNLRDDATYGAINHLLKGIPATEVDDGLFIRSSQSSDADNGQVISSNAEVNKFSDKKSLDIANNFVSAFRTNEKIHDEFDRIMGDPSLKIEDKALLGIGIEKGLLDEGGRMPEEVQEVYRRYFDRRASKSDQAEVAGDMVSSPNTPGGIDLNREGFNLETQGISSALDLGSSFANISAADVTGMRAVIVSTVPIGNIQAFLQP